MKSNEEPKIEVPPEVTTPGDPSNDVNLAGLPVVDVEVAAHIPAVVQTWEMLSEEGLPNGATVRRVRLLETGGEYTFSWAEDSDKASWREQMDTWAARMNDHIAKGHGPDTES